MSVHLGSSTIRHCLLPLIIFIFSAQNLFSDEVSTVSKLRSSLERLGNCEVRATMDAFTSSTKLILEGKADSPTIIPQGKNTYLFRRDMGKNLALVSCITEKIRDGKPSFFEYEWSLDQNETLYVQGSLDSNRVQIKQDQNLGVSLSNEELGGKKSRIDFNSIMEGLNDHGIVFGYLGYFPIVEYFDKSARISFSDEGKLVKVVSVSHLGHLEMWLDSNAGFLPRKFELIKQGADLVRPGKSIEELKMNGDQKTWPDGGVKRQIWKADNIILGEKDDVFYIQGIKLDQVIESQAGPIVTMTTEALVSEANFNPDFNAADFIPRLKIPKGTPVAVEGADYLPYEWDGQKAVPIVSDFNRALNQKRNGDRWFSPMNLVIANLVLFLMIAFFFFYQKHRQRNLKP